MTKTEQIASLYTRHVLPTYAPPRLALVKGKGTRVWDAEGRVYLDFAAGIAVLSVLAFGMDRRPVNRAWPRVRIDRRWAWYWLIIGSGVLLMTPLQDPELPLASVKSSGVV